MDNEKKVYSEMLNDILSGYDGEFKNLFSHLPGFFNTLQNLYTSGELTWECKFKINACFSYFAIPDDLVSDLEGPEGFIDDLFLCAYVLYDICLDNPALVQQCWEEDGDASTVIENVLDTTEELMGDKCVPVLNFTGLLKFDVMSRDLNLLTESLDIDKKGERLDFEIAELKDLLRSILVYSGINSPFHTFKSIERAFTKKELEQVQLIIERKTAHSSKYDNRHELEFEKIMRKIILGIDEGILDV